MILVSIVIACTAAILLLPTLSDGVSILRSARPRQRSLTETPEPPRFVLLIPAHDEEMLIGACVASLRSLRYQAERFRAIVIADNCTDRTAELVRAAGVECMERDVSHLPGKPRAIEWALERIRLADFDAVAIIDADTIVDADFLASLATAAPLAGKAVQGYHGVSNPRENALTRMSAVFAAARYGLAFPLKQRAGLNVPLMGNGMVIGTGVLARYGWNAFSICEDWELYAQLTEAGVRIETVPGARVYSQEANSLRQSTSQRQRWAAGKLTVLFEKTGPLLRRSGASFHQKLDALAELSAPGPAVHLGTVLVLGFGVYALSVPGSQWLIVALGFSLLRLMLYTAYAIVIDSQPIRAALAFVFLPFYTVWRLAIQITAFTMIGERPWVRTQRHQSTPAAPSDAALHEADALVPAVPGDS